MKRLMSFCLALALLSIPANVYADIAPPSRPPGSTLGPGIEGTEVRMVAETVLIDVLPNNATDRLGQARVTADFTMRNLGNETENMDVRFPISASNGFGDYPELKNVIVKVDGKSVPTKRVMEEDLQWSSGLVPWVAFNVTFLPGQDVQIQVSYLLDGTGEYPFVAYFYILHTGEGWKDTIGSADIIVRLPYEANQFNVIFDEQIGWSQTTAGGVIDDREIRWHFEELEPDRGSDFELSIVNPTVWGNILKEQANVQGNPNDGEAWGRLGKLYKEIFFYRRDFRRDVGGKQLYPLSVEAYENAVRFLPDDALWHAGYADLLSVHAYYAQWDGEDMTAEMLRSMQEIDRALELSPNDPKVNEIALDMYYLFPNAITQLESGLDFPWLTATPVVESPTVAPAPSTPTLEAPPTAVSTATTVPTKEAVPVLPTDVPVGGNPLCGSMVVVPLVFVWMTWRKVYG